MPLFLRLMLVGLLTVFVRPMHLLTAAFLLALGASVFSANCLKAAEFKCIRTWKGTDAEIAAFDKETKEFNDIAKPRIGACFDVEMKGRIEKGDFNKLFEIYKQNHPHLGDIVLNSHGGDVVEAIKIGRFLRKYLIKAHAHNNCEVARRIGGPMSLSCFAGHVIADDGLCGSACALIWIGAPERSGTVGLHRPHFEDPEFKALSFAEAQKVYSQALTLTKTYLDEMEATKEFIDLNATTNSNDISWIKDDKLERSPSFSEWLTASCGSIFPLNEEKELRRLESLVRGQKPRTFS